MATITSQNGRASGAVAYAAASAGGDAVVVQGSNTELLVRNASAGSINVTIVGITACSQGVVHNTVVACPIGDTNIPIPSWAVNPSNNQASVTYSATASITVAAVYN